MFEWYMCKSDKKSHSNLFCLKSDRQKNVKLAQKGVKIEFSLFFKGLLSKARLCMRFEFQT